MRCRVTNLDVDQAIQLASDGGLLVGAYQAGKGAVVLLSSDDGKVAIATGEIDQRRRVKRSALLGLTSDPDERTSNQDIRAATQTWLVIEHPELYDADRARFLHDHPVRRLMQILRPEWTDIWQILIFAFVAGVLSLATPIAVESLVNTVSFGRQLQPVVVLAALLFGFLAFAGVMKALQTYVAEVIQRRLFARISGDLAYRLPRVDRKHWDGSYGPELVNRFLDVVTLQKVVATLLLDGVSIVLATLVGMTVLAFYHPWLLGFDVLLLLLIVSGLYVLGRGAISSGIDESKIKYKLTSWLEDVIRCEEGFKMHGGADFAIDRANLITANYLSARQRHFHILFRQIIYVVALQAVAGTVLLGGGGWLVIQGQLSLGQLVAAELIVTTILASLAKLGKHLEGFYDLVAAVDKLGYLFDLGVERYDGILNLTNEDGLEIRFTNLECVGSPSNSQHGLSTNIQSGERVAVLGPAASGKTTLLRIIYGLATPHAGHVEVGGVDPLDLRPDVLRSHVALVGGPELFEGTIAENVHLRRLGVSSADARQALEEVGLLEDVLKLTDSLDTKINATGIPLSYTQQLLLMLARGIAGKPALLLIDGVLDQLPDNKLEQVLRVVQDNQRDWTVIVATGRRTIANRLNETIDLSLSLARKE